MAYTKIKQIKTNTHLQQSIDYIINPGKTEEMLRLYFNNRAEYERIKANHNKTKIEKIAPNAEHSKSAAVYNINTQIRMFNLMGEYGIKTPEELNEKIAELEKQEKQYADSIKSVEAMIESNEDKVRAIREYLRLKVYYDEYKSKITTYDKELYSLDHYYDLEKYKKAAERISGLKLPDGSLPNADTLDAHIKAEQDRMKLFSEKHKSIMTELRNLHLVKENIEMPMIFVFRRNKFLLHTHSQWNCKQFQIQWELGQCITKVMTH